MASRLGPAPIATTAEAFGLGRRTGIELPGEAAGIVPSPEWKRAAASLPEDERRWWPGDTFNLGLGQGYLCVTPVQMAVACAALANGGRLFRPRLILDGSAPPPVSEIAAAPAALAAVRLGMEAVVDGRRGTGREARVEGVRMAAKTGTAQAGTPARPRTWAWMILYAPVEAPRYAVAMVIEDGASGGSAVAPRLGAMMRRVFNAEGQTAEPWLALRD